jgi:signal transduction histidine kinase
MDESLWERIHRLMARLSEELDEAPPRTLTDERELAERIRRELRRYEEHRHRLSPPDRERLLEFVVDDLVGLTRAYAPAAPAEAAGADEGAAARAFRLLVDAGEVLAGSLEYEAALDRLARLCTGWFADACGVHLVDAGQIVRRAAAVGPGRESLAGLGAAPLDSEHPHHPIALALRFGETVNVDEVTPEYVRSIAPEPLTRHALQLRAVLSVPLSVRGRLLGALTFVRTRGGRPYAGGEVALAEELARRAALAVEDALLRDEAERASRARAEFVGSISHEFRTPLMTVMAFAHLLQEGIPSPIPAPAREHVERILAAVGHLDRLVEESLGYRRAEAGWDTVQPRPVDLRAVARESAALIEPLALQKGLDFEVEVGPGPSVAQTDADKVRQILFNLLGNAVKFTDYGVIRLDLRTEGERAVFEVTDTGVGIAPEHLEPAFEPFWQAEPGAVERGPGIGLGLALVRRLTWMLGGDVRVASEPGRGSVFRVSIPLG